MTRRTMLTALMIASLTSIAFAGNNRTRQFQLPKKFQVQIPKQLQAPISNHVHNHGSSGNAVRQVVIDDGNGQSLAYFSNRLGARFVIQSIQVGNYSPVLAARIVSDPRAGSPLQQLNLSIGDVITRLDGIPVTSTQELERHIFDTKVRFVRAGSQSVSQGYMWVDKNRYFQETYYPCYACNSGTGGGGLRP